MRLLYLGSDDAYAVRRLRQEAARRRIVFTVLTPRDLALATCRRPKLVDVLVIRTQQPQWIPHILTLARLYHTQGKIVVDAALASQPAIYSKFNDLLILQESGINVPKTLLVSDRTAALRAAKAAFGFPLVLKGIHGAEGKNVHRVRNGSETRRILNRYHEGELMLGELMLQEYIDAPYDFRVIVIGYCALPMILRRYPKRNDFRTNARLAARVEALPIAQFPNIKKIAERSAKILRREFTGIDIRLKRLPQDVIPSRAEGSRSHKNALDDKTDRQGTPLILEVNRQPEFETFEKTTGLNVAGEFLEYVIRCSNRVTTKSPEEVRP